MTKEEKKRENQRRWRKANKHKVSEYKRRYREENSDKVAEYQRQWREANRDHRREYQRRWHKSNQGAQRDYALDRNGFYPAKLYRCMTSFQMGRCSICRGSVGMLHADHCHRRLEPRGLLCAKCNQGLGLLNDDKAAIRRAIDYLQKPPTDIKWTYSAEHRHANDKYDQPARRRWRQIEADLLAQQGSICPVFNASEPGGPGRWHIDHCHKSGFVRGVLSHNANIGLGCFKDNPGLLQEAIDYLNWYTPTNEAAHKTDRFRWSDHQFFLEITK